MRTFFLGLRYQVTALAMLVLGGAAHAQEVPAFLRDVIRGSAHGRIHLEQRTYHLAIARELAYRTLVLSRCSNVQEAVRDPRFDAFGEAILQEMGSPNPDTLTIFTAAGRLQEAAIQNALTDGHINVIRRIMGSPQYDNFIEYLSFERAIVEISSGFVDINTGGKAPWIAAAALAYVRSSMFYPVLLANISTEEKVLLERRELDGLNPSAQIVVDDGYLEALISLFERQNASVSLRESLPLEIRSLLTLYELLGIEAMRGDALLAATTPPEQRASCRSKNVANCVDNAWLAAAIATSKKLDENQYRLATRIMRDRFLDVCKPRIG
ncbi:hypothetical protein PEC18_03040 [Paucibacter sp. O1-1]|nr:hypothetical protein [Paucibacter sp. O1-1]MDA3824854.1 hypothetical protein [Paucibacter sp. O1-1]